MTIQAPIQTGADSRVKNGKSSLKVVEKLQEVAIPIRVLKSRLRFLDGMMTIV